MTDTLDHRTPSSNTDPSQTIRDIDRGPRVVLPLSAAGDRRVCAEPLSPRTARGLGVRSVFTSAVWGRRIAICSWMAAIFWFFEIER